MHPGMRLAAFCPQDSHDRAKAEFVPVAPPRVTQKLTNAEHHGTELGCGPRVVVAKYWLIRGSPWPSESFQHSCISLTRAASAAGAAAQSDYWLAGLPVR